MNGNEIEKRLADGLSAAAPDILDSLMEELRIDGVPEPSLRDRLADDTNDRYEKARVSRRSLKALVSCAAALVLVIAGFSVWSNAGSRVLAVVDIDVNPSIELAINNKEKVVGAKAFNEEGEAILGDMDLKGTDVKVACSAIIGSMVMNGYLNDHSNSVLLSVSSEDAGKSFEIEEQLAGSINDYLGISSFPAAVSGQCVIDDDELRNFAEKNGISPGKAWLIRKLLDSGSARMTEDSLLALSTQELIMLSRERDVQGDTEYGTVDTAGYVSRDSALEAALSHAGLQRSEVTDAQIEMDCEDGKLIYEVEFNSGGYEYEYDIDAATGEVIESETESHSGDIHDSDDNDDDDDDYDDRDDDDDDDRDDDDDDDRDDDDDDDDD